MLSLKKIIEGQMCDKPHLLLIRELEGVVDILLYINLLTFVLFFIFNY